MKKRVLILTLLMIFSLPVTYSQHDIHDAQLRKLTSEIMGNLDNIYVMNQKCVNTALKLVKVRLDELVGSQAFLEDLVGDLMKTGLIKSLKKLGDAYDYAEKAWNEIEKYQEDPDAIEFRHYNIDEGWIRWGTKLAGFEVCDIDIKVLWIKNQSKVRFIALGDCPCTNDLDNFHIQFDVDVRESPTLDPNDASYYEISGLSNYGYGTGGDFLVHPDSKATFLANCCDGADNAYPNYRLDEIEDSGPRSHDKTVKLPKTFIKLIGPRQVVEAEVNTEEKGAQKMLVKFYKQKGQPEDTYTTQILGPESFDKPTLKVKTNEYVLWRLRNDEDPIELAKEMMESGALSIKPIGVKLNLVHKIASIANKQALKKKTAWWEKAIKESRELEIRNERWKLERQNQLNLARNLKDRNNLMIINNVGRPSGYTTQKNMDLISVQPQRYSNTAGIYNTPINTIKSNYIPKTRVPTIQITPGKKTQASNTVNWAWKNKQPYNVNSLSNSMKTGAKYAYAAANSGIRYSSRYNIIR